MVKVTDVDPHPINNSNMTAAITLNRTSTTKALLSNNTKISSSSNILHSNTSQDRHLTVVDSKAHLPVAVLLLKDKTGSSNRLLSSIINSSNSNTTLISQLRIKIGSSSRTKDPQLSSNMNSSLPCSNSRSAGPLSVRSQTMC